MDRLKYIGVVLLFVAIIGSIVCLFVKQMDNIIDYLFVIIANTGPFFSYFLAGIFIAGMYVVIDRFLFFIMHIVFTRRLLRNSENSDTNNHNVFDVFLRFAREFRATSEEGVYSDEIIDHARGAAMECCLDSQEIDWGRTCLEFLGVIAPTVGFIGTLVGLIASFQELAAGGKLTGILHGLALSMTTSLIGAIISVIFLSAAWVLGHYRRSFDNKLYKIIASAQQSDTVGS